MNMTGYAYHRQTSYFRFQKDAHYLDWPNQPSVFKHYKDAPLKVLPKMDLISQKGLIDVVHARHFDAPSGSMDIEMLSGMLWITYGITAKTTSKPEFYFRSAASAGALYPVEVYVVVYKVKNMVSGLYHYDVHNHALHLIRDNTDNLDISPWIEHFDSAKTECLFLTTTIFFRSCWKYRDRAYRYHLLDNGHVLSNLSLAVALFDMPQQLFFDFDDHKINSFLGVDAQREVCLSILAVLGQDRQVPSASQTSLKPLKASFMNASQVSLREKQYPLVWQMHLASDSIHLSPPQIQKTMLYNFTDSPVNWIDVKPDQDHVEKREFVQSIMMRRSRRNFIQNTMSKGQFCYLLDLIHQFRIASATYPASGSDAVSIGLAVQNVDGITAGFYIFDAINFKIGMVSKGLFMSKLAKACLNQEWLKNACLAFLFMGDLNWIDQSFGPRGYRYVMQHSGQLGQLIYLGATAIDAGCCGIGAYYDEEININLGLLDDIQLLYLLGVGPVKRF